MTRISPDGAMAAHEGPVGSASVEAIFVVAGHGELPRRVDAVRAVAGAGLEGDRWFGDGTGADLTLVEAEALEALLAEHGIELDGAASRRNVLTRGVRLNELVGERFRLGEVECRGLALCQPCLYLEKLTAPGVLRGLVHRGGLRAEILAGGVLRRGDPVVRTTRPAAGAHERRERRDSNPRPPA